jgi:hypothetical protein
MMAAEVGSFFSVKNRPQRLPDQRSAIIIGAVASTYIRVADENEAMKADPRPLSPGRHKSGINGNLGKFYGYVFELHDLGDGSCEEKEDLVVMTKT